MPQRKRLADLRRRYFPITLTMSGLVFTLGNATMFMSHLTYLKQIGCTGATEVEVS